MAFTDKEKEVLIESFSNSIFKGALYKVIDEKVAELRGKMNSPMFRDYQMIHGGIVSLIELKNNLEEIKE